MNQIASTSATAPVLTPKSPQRHASGTSSLADLSPKHAPVNTATDQPCHDRRDRSTSRESSRSLTRNEARRTARRRSMDLVAEAKGDVVSFVHELEQKRKQLDEQIHKFIAAKEREYKRFEQEIRRQYQSATPGVQSLAAPQEHTVSPASTRHSSRGAPQAPSATDQVQTEGAPTNVRSQIDRRSANSGLEDVRPSSEREKDFMGLFTPSFLPLLGSNKQELEKSPSAPNLSDHGVTEVSQPRPEFIQRANTEPLISSDGSPRPGNGQRSQSCSSGDGLVSALKSSSGRKPKPMRVMLQLGDDMPAVHPNDDLPIEREYAPVRQAEAMHHSKSGRPKVEDESPLHSPKSPQNAGNAAVESIPPAKPMFSSLTQGLVIKPSTPLAPPMSRAHSRDITDDFDDVASPFPLDEETHGAGRSQEPDWEVDFQENIEEAPLSRDTPSTMTPEMSISSSPPAEVTGGQGVPMLKIRSSSSSSIQPISPGFSRPSVQEDPKFYFDTREVEHVDNVAAQSSFYDSFSRPSLPGRAPMIGSLGESYMQRNAEEMMRKRRS